MLSIFVNGPGKKDPMVRYLTGYDPEFCIVVYDNDSKKKCMFVVPFELSLFEGITCFAYSSDSFKKEISKFFRKRNISIIGIHKPYLSVIEHERLKKLLSCTFTDVSKLCITSRMTKTVKEMKAISKACVITDKMFRHFVRGIRSKKIKTELDGVRFLKQLCIKYDVIFSFDPIVATGSATASPHHIATEAKLSGFVLLDFGVKVEGYCSDMTRMLYLGKPTQMELEVYTYVLKVYESVIHMLAPGVRLRAVDAYVRMIFGDLFVHALGHGVGVEIHERPHISPISKDRLSPGMVFTIEPGIYGSFGIRIEDTFVCTKSGVQALTKSSRDLVILK